MGYVGYYSLHEVDREVSQMNEIKEVEKKLLLASKFAEQYHSKQEQGLVNKINDELSEATRMANDLHEILHSEEDKEIVGNVKKDIELYKDVFGRVLKNEKIGHEEWVQFKKESKLINSEIEELEKSMSNYLKARINDEELRRYVTELVQLYELSGIIGKLKDDELNFDLTGEDQYVQLFNKDFNDAKNKANEVYENLSNQEYKAIVKEMLHNLDLFKKEFEELVATDHKLKEEFDSLNNASNDVISLAEEVNHQLTEQMHNQVTRADLMIIIFLIIGLIVGVSIGILITRSITISVNKGLAFAKQISKGDLTATVDVNQKDEIGNLIDALREMNTQIKEVVTGVQTGSNNIAAASHQLSSTSQQISQGASEQASSSEEVSSSMEEMASNIQQNTDNANQTEKISLKAATDIKNGNEAFEQTVHSMKDIADKIGIISEIARQTNILALNAAVEAARAGEHGKGFAVVAEEVRKLAARSQDAAKEIDETSKSSVLIAEKAGKLLSEIVPDIEKTAKLIQEISAASNEQTSGANQVNDAINQLSQVTQQNAAASEEMATSSEELSSQAEQLKELMAFFTVDDNVNKSVRKSNQKYNMPNKSFEKKTQNEEAPKFKTGVKIEMNESDTDFESF
ncbi:MAG: methyl-accepting chemotaxis protein [Salinivirgaceae bacterium]|nr:MAG: methyl-accepting chemotaxis protein [Salinivirgaceae bacterium]